MTLHVWEGFEFYNAGADMGLNGSGLWTSTTIGSALLSNFTRFGVGKSLQTSSTLAIYKDTSSTNATGFMSCAFILDTPLSGTNRFTGFTFSDGATGQCGIWFTSGGNIELRAGSSSSGTVLSTYSSAFLASQWNNFQFKIVFNNGAGEWHVRKNGNTSDDHAATGLVTIATANAYANRFTMTHATASVLTYIDDVVHWDAAGSGVWTDWIGDTRITAQYPNSVNTSAFSQTNGGSTTFGNTTNTGNQARATNTISLWPFTPACGGTLGNPTLELNASLTGHINLALYESDGDTSATPTSNKAPSVLIGECAQLTNPGSGANVFTWNAAPRIRNGKVYFFALFADAAYTPKDSGANNIGVYTYALAYGSFPSTLSGLGTATSFRNAAIYATITPTNDGLVDDFSQDGATTFVYSSTVNNEDLYGVTPLPTTPSAIYAVAVIGMISKSDAGSRGVKLELKSSSTTQQYTEVFPNTSFNYYKYEQDTDPATGVAWTPTGLNNALVGQKVTT